MFPLGIVNQGGTPAPSWNKVLEMKFNNNFNDSTGRHSPVSYGAVTSSTQSVEGGYSMYANQNGRVFTDDFGGDNADFNIGTGDIRIVCDLYPTSIGNDYLWMKSSGNDFGYCVRLIDVGGGNISINLRDNNNSGVADVTVANISGKWTNLDVRRESEVWTIRVDDVLVATSLTVLESSFPTSGAGKDGFTIAGAANTDRYSGYIDNFIVYTK